MKIILVHPKNPVQHDKVIEYLFSQRIEFEVKDAEQIEENPEASTDKSGLLYEDLRGKRIHIKPEIIKEIAEQLDIGMVCYYHKTTGELESYPDEMHNPGFDEELWEEVINKVDENSDDYMRFEAMSSSESFRVMEGFISNIDHIPTYNKFIEAISRKKPFRNFSDLLHYYPDLREQWFKYKEERYIEFVQDQIEFE